MNTGPRMPYLANIWGRNCINVPGEMGRITGYSYREVKQHGICIPVLGGHGRLASITCGGQRQGRVARTIHRWRENRHPPVGQDLAGPMANEWVTV